MQNIFIQIEGHQLIKYASNAFLATKITFINEIANLCEKTNINVEDISIGMGLDKRIGSRFLKPDQLMEAHVFQKIRRQLLILQISSIPIYQLMKRC